MPPTLSSITILGTADKQLHLYPEHLRPYILPFYPSIGDAERTSGLYILGKPRMGKSWLLINMILQDIEAKKGVFFIDPHGEAIDQLVTHTNAATSPFIVYDFENEETILGINPLGGNRADPAGRDAIFARTKALFDKLWKNTFEEKPWLQLIIQNTIYAFIENPDFTLVDFPMFFRDRDFRRFLVENMHYNMAVKDYWLQTFTSKDKYSQERIIEAAQTRCEIMFAHPAVRHFFGHTAYIDIGEYIESTTARLVKLSTRLPYEVKKIIGTALLNELVFAIQKRKIGQPLYCIYIDEFQNFVSFEDMATLITQAPKFGISTTLAHHERFGQLEDDKRIIGATSTIANKVLFQITGKDAHDFAPEFRKEPPEIQDDDVYVISQNPFYDLLQGHRNQQIREFVNSHIRPLKERMEDISTDAQLESYIRMDFLDEANLFRIDERVQTSGKKDQSVIHGSLHSAARSIQSARGQTTNLKELAMERLNLRVTIREMNRFLTDLMEGKLAPGQEAFAQFITRNVYAMVSLSEVQKKALELYIAITYGNSQMSQPIPYEVAKDFGLFYDEVKKSTEDALKLKQEKINKYERWLQRDWYPNEHVERVDVHWALSKSVPADLRARILTREEIIHIQLRLYEELKMPMKVIDEFVKFCVLLAKPENHLQVKVHQKPQKAVQTRTFADMTNEMEGELTELPKYTAYAKVLKGKEMWKGKITTHPLPSKRLLFRTKTYEYSPDQLRLIINSQCFNRTAIEEAIRQRQENWRPQPEMEEELTKPIEEPKRPEPKTEEIKKERPKTAKKGGPPPTHY